MANWGDRFDDIVGAGIVALVAMVMIYVILEFAATLVPSAPSWIGGVLIGSVGTLAIRYIYLRYRGDFQIDR